MLKVLYFLRDDGGCGLYRASQPLETARMHGAMDVHCVKKGDREADIAPKIAWAEVCLIPRVSSGPFFTNMAKFKEMGKRIVVDWDDDIFNVSPLSPHYFDFGTKDYSHKIPGGSLDVWKTGVNEFNPQANEARLEKAKEAMRGSDMVTCTTETLAKIFRKYSGNVKALPNHIDTQLWKKLPLKPHQGIRMGWFGGHSHYEDWCLMSEVLPAFMKANPDVTLVLMGARFDGTLKEIDPKRIEFHPWIHTQAYPYKAAVLDLDFAVVPLVDNDFNNCKSHIKWIEFAALEVPAVTSWVDPYDKLPTDTDNGIFVEANSAKGWWEGMNQLAQDKALREKMGKEARATVENNFDINKTYPLWVQVYEEFAKCPPQSIQPSLVS